jgi:UDP-N-acetylmuramoylalanine--D-glutamate ligase
VRLNGHEFIYKRELSPLIGIHNTENILTALLTAHIYGIEKQVTEDVLKNFKGLSHRVEHVRSIDGVGFYNDSKATNVDATKRALESMGGHIILIAGGKDKGGSYKAITEVANKVKALIAIGEAKEKIIKELGSHMNTYSENDMEGAVRKAREIALAGDMVLLSPMCSSFDMFKDYKERGNIFRKIVESL